MTNRGLTTVVLCAVTVTSAGAAEQARPGESIEALAVPSRVRLDLTDGRRLTCDLLRIENDGVLVRSAGRLRGPSWTVPFADVRGAERSLGRRRGRGALIGGLIGAAAAGALVLSSADGVGCHSGECLCSGGGCFTAFIVLGTPAAATGGVIGALTARERWVPLDLGRAGTPSTEARPPAGQRAHVPGALRMSWTIRF